jgi:uncharacterized protein (DUF58 family)
VIPKAQVQLSGLIVVPVLLAVALYALAVLTGNMWFTLLAGGAVGLVVGARIWCPKLDGLELCYSGPRRAAVGEPVVHTLHVHNRSDRPTPALCIAEHLPGLAIARVYVEPLPGGGRAVVELSRVAVSRGISFNGRISVVAQGGLGLVVAHATVDHGHRLVVHPRAVLVGGATSHARADDEVDFVPGPGTDVAGVREWRPGDAANSVHWRSTARRGTLVVRERAAATSRHVVVALACSSDAPDWEDVIAAAAGACRAAQLAGDRLTLWVWANGHTLAAPPVQSVLGLLDWWAVLPSSHLPAPDTLARALTSINAADVRVAASASATEQWWDEVRQATQRGGALAHRLPVPS